MNKFFQNIKGVVMKYRCPECKAEYITGKLPSPEYCTMLSDDDVCGALLVEVPEEKKGRTTYTGEALSYKKAIDVEIEILKSHLKDAGYELTSREFALTGDKKLEVAISAKSKFKLDETGREND